MRILLIVFPVVALSSLSTALLAGLGHIRVPLVANAVAALADVGLAFALVPHLNANGAAIANAAGQATYSLIMLAAAERIVAPVAWRGGVLVRNAVAATAGGLAAWGVLEELGGGIAGLIGGAVVLVAVYGALAVLLRVIPGEDAAWLEETVPQPVVRRICRLCAERLAAAAPDREERCAAAEAAGDPDGLDDRDRPSRTAACTPAGPGPSLKTRAPSANASRIACAKTSSPTEASSSPGSRPCWYDHSESPNRRL